MSKVSFISVRPVHNSYGLFSIIPLGSVYMATILHQRGYETTVFDEARTHVFNAQKEVFRPEIGASDFVGISVISPAANRAFYMLKTLRHQYPGIRIAVGGPHVMGDEQAEIFARYADVVVQREGEDLIEDLVNGSYSGIIEGTVVKNLDLLPIPDFSLVAPSRHKWLDYFKLTPVSTCRGCPRDCEFCTVSNVHGRKVRRRSTHLIMEELNQRLEEGYQQMFFTDDNFSIQPLKRFPLLEEMADQREKTKWFKSIIIQDEVPGILKGGDAYVRLLKKAGIKTVMLGVESFDDEKLRAMNKSHNKTESEKAIRLLHKHGLLIYAFGMAKPEIDDKRTIRNQFRKLQQEGVTYADMTIETPVPGTRYWEQAKSKIIATRDGYPDWDKWTFLSPVIPTQYMSPREFQKTVKKNMKRFYSPIRALKEILRGKLRRGLTILYVWSTADKMYN